jgi:hypothetical protein
VFCSNLKTRQRYFAGVLSQAAISVFQSLPAEE